MLEVHLESFLTLLWKHVIVVEILRHRCDITSPQQKENAIANLIGRVKKRSGERRAIEYVAEYGESFWADTNDRVREIVDKWTKDVDRKFGGSVGIGQRKVFGGEAHGDDSRHQRWERYDREEMRVQCQAFVDNGQVAALSAMIRLLDTEVLDSTQHLTYLIIDDLDKDWVSGNIANLLIRCLFQAVMGFQGVENLKIVIALRSNIFEHLGFGRAVRGGQEEKYRLLARTITWTPRSLEHLLQARLAALTQRHELGSPLILRDLLPIRSKVNGDPLKYVLDRTLLRPRDAISFVNECIRKARLRTRITWKDISAAEGEYSNDRLKALRDEWEEQLPGIDRGLAVFRSSLSPMSKEALAERMDDIMGMLGGDIPDNNWLTPICEKRARPGEADWHFMYDDLGAILFRIGFIGLSVKNAPPTYSYTDEHYFRSTEARDEAVVYHVHPMFHRALGIRLPIGSIVRGDGGSSMLPGF